jgi:hypothetical protein
MRAEVDLRCPVCLAVDWLRDGLSFAEDDWPTGEIIRERVAPPNPGHGEVPWVCDACGYQVPKRSRLFIELQRLVTADLE